MSVQKKSLISQRAAVTKAIVATPESEKGKAKTGAQVMPKIAGKKSAKLSANLHGKVRYM